MRSLLGRCPEYDVKLLITLLADSSQPIGWSLFKSSSSYPERGFAGDNLKGEYKYVAVQKVQTESD